MAKRETVSVIGPGRMGIGIAQQVATSGYMVSLVDTKERSKEKEMDSLHHALSEIRSNLLFLKNEGQFVEDLEVILSRITLRRGIDGRISEDSFIFEALPEQVSIKREFLAQINPFLRERTIIASTTSTISLDSLKDTLTHPRRLIITHWLNPPFLVPLVEVAYGKETEPQVVSETKKFLQEMGKIPVICRDSPGFIGSRIQAAAMNEAARIVEEGVASPEEIDTAIKAGLGFRLSVLGLMEFLDFGGIDILFYAGNYLRQALGESHFEPPRIVKEKMDRNELGAKTGKGFYDFTDVDVKALFQKRYKGFIEMLEFIRNSKHIDFSGGIK